MPSCAIRRVFSFKKCPKHAWHRYLRFSLEQNARLVLLLLYTPKTIIMKLIKTISLALGMLAVTTAVNAQQTTTQKMENETPASGTAGTTFEKEPTTKHVSSNKAPDRNRKGRGVDPSLSNSTTGKVRANATTQKAVRADSPVRNRANSGRSSTGTRSNAKQNSATTPRQASQEIRKQ